MFSSTTEKVSPVLVWVTRGVNCARVNSILKLKKNNKLIVTSRMNTSNQFYTEWILTCQRPTGWSCCCLSRVSLMFKVLLLNPRTLWIFNSSNFSLTFLVHLYTIAYWMVPSTFYNSSVSCCGVSLVQDMYVHVLTKTPIVYAQLIIIKTIYILEPSILFVYIFQTRARTTEWARAAEYVNLTSLVSYPYTHACLPLYTANYYSVDFS